MSHPCLTLGSHKRLLTCRRNILGNAVQNITNTFNGISLKAGITQEQTNITYFKMGFACFVIYINAYTLTVVYFTMPLSDLQRCFFITFVKVSSFAKLVSQPELDVKLIFHHSELKHSSSWAHNGRSCSQTQLWLLGAEEWNIA